MPQDSSGSLPAGPGDTVAESPEVARRERIRAGIYEAARLAPGPSLMNLLAALVATYALLADSIAGVIGAMIIAQLLSPIAGVSLALLEDDTRQLGTALKGLVGGVLVVVLAALLIGALHHDVPLTTEMLTRTRPGLFDLAIALASGIAGAYAYLSPQVSTAVVGVAVSTALVPPLCTSAVLAVRGEWPLAGGALLLTVTNVVAIQLACSLVLWVSGIGSRHRKGSREHRGLVARHALSVSIFVVLVAVLGAGTRDAVARAALEKRTRAQLRAALDICPGARVAETQITEEDGTYQVSAVVHSPRALTGTQVGRLEDALPTCPGGQRPRLRVRWVPVTVITRDGLEPVPDMQESVEAAP